MLFRSVLLSKCCNPVKGDDIIGYITRGRGISVHRSDCNNVKELVKDEDRIIEVHWVQDENAASYYEVEMEVDANDREGLLQDIMTVIQKADLKLTAISARALQEKIAIINFTIIVKNIEEITKTIRDIKKIDSVYDVKRKK